MYNVLSRNVKGKPRKSDAQQEGTDDGRHEAESLMNLLVAMNERVENCEGETFQGPVSIILVHAGYRHVSYPRIILRRWWISDENSAYGEQLQVHVRMYRFQETNILYFF